MVETGGGDGSAMLRDLNMCEGRVDTGGAAKVVTEQAGWAGLGARCVQWRRAGPSCGTSS